MSGGISSFIGTKFWRWILSFFPQKYHDDVERALRKGAEVVAEENATDDKKTQAKQAVKLSTTQEAKRVEQVSRAQHGIHKG